MKTLDVGLLLGTALLLGGSTSVSAQSRVEDADWWEVDSMERVHADDVSPWYSENRYAAPRKSRTGREAPGRRTRSSRSGSDHSSAGKARPIEWWSPPERMGPGKGARRAALPRVCDSRRRVSSWRHCRGTRYAAHWKSRRGPRWVHARWDGIRFSRGFMRLRGVNRNALRTEDLAYLIGNRTVRRLERHAVRLGAHGPIMGRIVDRGAAGIVIQVRAGRVPVANLRDYDRDRHVDAVHLNQAYG